MSEPVLRKRCSTCLYHHGGPSPCTGTCLNFDWQPRGGVIRLVRGRELACYGGMGIDFWRPKRDGGGSPNGTCGPGGGPGGPGIESTHNSVVGAAGIADDGFVYMSIASILQELAD